MISKFRLAGVSVLFVLATLAACGGGGGGGQSADSAAPPPTTAAPPPTTAAPPPTTAAPVGTATEVGVPTGSAASATIGAAGGKVSAPDGKISVAIPAGALASDTLISIQPVTNMAHGKIGAGYRLTPDGQTFLKPITLTFAYTDQDLLGTAVEVLGAAFQTKEGYWQWMGNAAVDQSAKTLSIGLTHFTNVSMVAGLDKSAKTLSNGVTHFTDVSLVAGVQIRPGKKTVKVKGSVALEVLECYPRKEIPGAGGVPLVPLGYKCDSEVTSLTKTNRASEWSVNSRPGGGGVFGTVIGNVDSATYYAPVTAPIPKTVAVSARVHLEEKGKTTLLVSNITIEDPALKVDGTYWDAYRLTGVICSLEEPFTLQAQANLGGAAATGTFSFTPDAGGGIWRFAGVMAGFVTYSGNGRYQLAGGGTESPSLEMDPGNGTWIGVYPYVGTASLGPTGNHLEVSQTVTTTPTEPCAAP